MAIKIIGIHGKMRSGKSVVCEALPKIIRNIDSNLRIHYCSLSTYIKQIAEESYKINRKEAIGWVLNNYNTFDSASDFSDKQKSVMVTLSSTLGSMLQWSGSNIREIRGQHFLPTRCLQSIPLGTTDIVIMDGVRHKSDAEWIKERGGQIISVERHYVVDGEIDITNGRDTHHSSETELDGYPFDYEFINNNTNTRQEAVDNIVNNYSHILKL